jgi:cyclopropane-fatty-acyl-phospholipid synthase
MTMIGTAIRVFEQAPVPDSMTRLAIKALCARTSHMLAALPENATAAFAQAMPAQPIAMHVEAANAQHYEVPADFFGFVLGPQRKYSCCLYETPAATLADAEEAALAETARRAQLANGQTILELGCGWGSLSLWMARRFPESRILAVSNSYSQRAHIEKQIALHGLTNLNVMTADVNAFRAEDEFDRIVSIEMFDHRSHWQGP